ncbi:MAG: methyltransferase domain-containing protein [Actinobacteria bacterium]|nr:methyltransferase domain-containing protein [Actinomycetota bacterium]
MPSYEGIQATGFRRQPDSPLEVVTVSAASSRRLMMNIPRRLANSRLFWDYVMGPSYNRHVLKIERDLYSFLIDVIDERCAPPENARILDVGSGPGLLAAMLAEKYPHARVVGIDFSPRQVRTANRLLSRRQAGNCSFHVGNADDLPHEDNSFDLVVSTFSLSSWPDIKRGLAEIRRVLACGGKACIIDADSSATEEEIRLFARAYASTGINRYVNEWITRRLVFGPAIAITNHKAATLAENAGFSSVAAEKLPGIPFFILELLK